MRLLLDTHTLIWLLHGNAKLPESARNAIRNAGSLSISIASLWEISIKQSIGKLDELEESVSEIEGICHRANIEILPITTSALERIQQLPDIHRDPFDRLLVATAIDEGLALVTNDSNIAKYDVETVWEQGNV